MSIEPEDLEELDSDDPDLVKKLRSHIREQNKRVKAAAAAETERDQLARELALTRAGIPDTGAGRYFVKTYDGPLDPDAIRTAAIEAEVMASGGPSAEDMAAHRRMEAAGTGAAPANAGPDIAKELADAAAAGGRYDGPSRIMEVLRRHNLTRYDVSMPGPRAPA